MSEATALPQASPGWIGTADQIEQYLYTVRADRDDDGRFKIYTLNDHSPVSFLGMDDEFVLHGSEEYSVAGVRRNLAEGLRHEDVGLGVMVL